MKRLNVLALHEKILLALLAIVGGACAALSYAGYVKNVEFHTNIKSLSEEARIRYDLLHSNKSYTYLNKGYCHRSDIDPNFICILPKNYNDAGTNNKTLDCTMLSVIKSSQKIVKEKSSVVL